MIAPLRKRKNLAPHVILCVNLRGPIFVFVPPVEKNSSRMEPDSSTPDAN